MAISTPDDEEEDLPAMPTRKRRRLNDGTKDGARRKNVILSDETDMQDASFETIDDGIEGAHSGPSSPGTSEQRISDAANITPEKKPKSKYKIHIPKNTALPPDTFYTQLPPASQSPYRIRPAYWQKSRPRSTSSDKRLNERLGPGEATHVTRQNVQANSEPKSTSTASILGVEIQIPTEGYQIVDVANPAEQALIHEPLGNVLDELADLPSDAFSSSPSSPSVSAPSRPIELSSQIRIPQDQRTAVNRSQRLVGPQTNLRQTTLFGDHAIEDVTPTNTQSTRRHNWPLASRDEPPTHHELDKTGLQTWVYPTNLGAIREYQYNIVSKGLYHNLLVALPTGLGKTFIAATIMLNWFRWTKDAQIVFVAPTKPLVCQQVEACFNIAGIPRSATTMLTGNTPPGVRAEEWLTKRVFFMTPQTIVNDLKTGICDPKRLVLLVVDEAHRATGGYAYVEVVKFLRRFNTSFRVLALTATPGASVESVQEVIDGLGISKVAIRTEESLDIRQYVHSRKIDTVLFEYTEEMNMIMDLFSKALQPILDRLNSLNAYWSRDPMMLTPYGLTQARQKWMASDAGRNASFPVKGMVNSIFTLLASLAHAVELLKFHGIGPFFHKVLSFQTDSQSGEKCGKYKGQIRDCEDFKTMMSRVQSWISNPDFVGHPKLDHVRNVVLNHFLDAGDGRAANGAPPSSTRIMVFAHYRDSAEEISRVLKRNQPMIRPHVFVGQANSKGSEGMDQKKQLEIIQKFRNGIFNTLVATSIGEEGLDIGEVDLIICYDASASPIRMLQRMGRTGRKRAGNIVVTLMRGKEENNFMQAKDNYEKMQRMIAEGNRFNFHEELAPRIVPKNINPFVDKRIIEIPPENTQSELPEPRKRSKTPKRPPKKFHMPDGVRKGFTKASTINDDEGSGDSLSYRARPTIRTKSPTPEPVPPLNEVLLTASQEADLVRVYQDVGGDIPQLVDPPSFDKYPDLQKTLRRTRYVKHGRITKNTVEMLQSMSKIPVDVEEKYSAILHDMDKATAIEQFEKRAAYFSRLAQSREALIIASQYDHLQNTSSQPDVRGREPTLPQINVSSDDDGDGADSLDNFVINDMQEEDMAAVSSASSPPPRSKPAHSSQSNSQKTTHSNSGEELPELDTLMQKRKSGAIMPVLTGLDSRKDMLRPGKRKARGRRQIVDDSDDE
ncbi:3'-5' DNA helicase [Bachmanniomyces sp. S44760]|nr:3'-5' DNA helicase [Bachmanniomyces sp. S44760]